MTHIVPIALVGKPPSIGGLPLEIGSITHVESGQLLVEPESTVIFEFYSGLPDNFESSSTPRDVPYSTSDE